MYRTICVPVDNSDHSKRAVDLAIELGKAFDSKLIGIHVYAAKMHEYRFKQMEYSLPEKYLKEEELEHQRQIHDSMIAMGLKLISESYVAPMKKRCEAEGLEFEARMMDGKNHVELVKDIRASKYDLVIMGVLGLGRGKDSQIGSVCERVTRHVDRDVWVVKQIPENGDLPSDTILVGIDGSPESFGALMQAIALAKKFDKRVECVAVYDPYLHYSVFKGLVGVLSEEASKVFNFEEQNQLHEDIIDNGLAQIYQSHLNVAETMAAEKGVDVVKTLLDGKAFQKVLDYARKTRPWLLVLGRVGVHSSKNESGLGGNSENLLRLCPCDVILTTGVAYPKLDVQAKESIRWTEEAEGRMHRVPDAVQGVARTAILRLAVEKGHSVITSGLVGEAMERYMPKNHAKSTAKLAKALAFDRMRDQPISICRACGLAASQPDPAKCGVCGATDFELITPEMFEEMARAEGGIEEEKTYDGRRLKWSVEARRAIESIEAKEQRRRVKTRIEKAARGNKLGVITLAFCRTIIEEETGKPVFPPPAKSPETPRVKTAQKPGGDREVPVAGTDAKGVPLQSAYSWTEDAAARILRVPAGFMRSKTQGYVEDLAAERGAAQIDLQLVEAGLQIGLKKMEVMVGGFNAQAQGAPVDDGSNSEDKAVALQEAAKDIELMNEVGLMSAMESYRESENQSLDTREAE